MKKVMTLVFMLALAAGAGAQTVNTLSASDTATVPGSTVHVPPVAKPGPVAVPGKKK
ncbi:MAG TPA: hypothetical protein VFB04_06785 [Terriglobales bacterium]|nr:hypothetical protein [Terriglobales bacterium]